MSGQPKSESLDDRVPCPDDMCVGILGPQGRCGTCGKQGEPGAPGEVHRVESHEEADEDPDDDYDGEDDDESPQAAEDGASPPDAAFDPEERVLCVDEMCTGVVGEGGVCGTCGRKA